MPTRGPARLGLAQNIRGSTGVCIEGLGCQAQPICIKNEVARWWDGVAGRGIKCGDASMLMERPDQRSSAEAPPRKVRSEASLASANGSCHMLCDACIASRRTRAHMLHTAFSLFRLEFSYEMK